MDLTQSQGLCIITPNFRTFSSLQERNLLSPLAVIPNSLLTPALGNHSSVFHLYGFACSRHFQNMNFHSCNSCKWNHTMCILYFSIMFSSLIHAVQYFISFYCSILSHCINTLHGLVYRSSAGAYLGQFHFEFPFMAKWADTYMYVHAFV